MDSQINKERLASFTNAYKSMISTNENAYKDVGPFSIRKSTSGVKDYSLDEIKRIINSTSTTEK